MAGEYRSVPSEEIMKTHVPSPDIKTEKRNSELSEQELDEKVDRIINHGEEARFFELLEGKEVLTNEEFSFLLESEHFKHVVHGTWVSPERNIYLYDKRRFVSEDLETARHQKAIAEDLTAFGILFPATRWGIYQTQTGRYRLFAVTRRLERSENDTKQSRFEPVLEELPARLGVIDDETAEAMPIVQYLNLNEAMHSHNWGYSPEFDEYFPIDIEVICFDENESVADKEYDDWKRLQDEKERK